MMANQEILAHYKNGNTTVTLYEDGTRIMETEDDDFDFEFPVSIDMNITNKCSNGCSFCYQNCTPDGKDAIFDAPFLDTLVAGTEIAVNLNNVDTSHFMPFLHKMKDQGVIVNATVHQWDFEKNYELLYELCEEQKLIHGLGISVVFPNMDFISKVKMFPNAVVHTVCGVVNPQDMIRLAGNDLKVLILGYKDKGRGHNYLSEENEKIRENMEWLKDNLKTMIDLYFYRALCFDCLSLEQLDVKQYLSEEEWNIVYQGRDGQLSLFVDLVDKTFGKSSLSQKSEMLPLMDNIRDMFAVVKNMD